jgi:hypothetical protein
MTMQAIELHESDQVTYGDDPQAVKRYRVEGTTDRDTALSILLAASPETATFWGIDLCRQRATIQPAGSDWWDASLTYGKRKKKEAGDWTLSWDTTGGTEKILQSLATTAYDISGTAPETYGAIGVHNGTVEGVDIVVPKFGFSINYTFDAKFLNPAMLLVHYNLTGRTNSAAFWGFAAGEVLFLGATGSTGSNDLADLSFKFAASPNTNVATAGITISKGGWQYVTFLYRDQPDTGGAAMIQRPIAAYCHTVYQSGNFGLLGIG